LRAHRAPAVCKVWSRCRRERKPPPRKTRPVPHRPLRPAPWRRRPWLRPQPQQHRRPPARRPTPRQRGARRCRSAPLRWHRHGRHRVSARCTAATEHRVALPVRAAAARGEGASLL